MALSLLDYLMNCIEACRCLDLSHNLFGLLWVIKLDGKMQISVRKKSVWKIEGLTSSEDTPVVDPEVVVALF